MGFLQACSDATSLQGEEGKGSEKTEQGGVNTPQTLLLALAYHASALAAQHGACWPLCHSVGAVELADCDFVDQVGHCTNPDGKGDQSLIVPSAGGRRRCKGTQGEPGAA